MRVVFFGMFGQLSRLPLEALLAAGVEVAAVVVPGDGHGMALRALPVPRLAIPLAGPSSRRTIVDVAWAVGIGAFAAGRLDTPEVLTQLASYAPHALCVSCFPRRFPQALLALAPLGALNLHPSPLPQLRGPAPLFWAFRQGLAATAATIHLMDAGLDSGPILVQEPVALPEGIDGDEAERRCALVGGRLMAGALAALADGLARPVPQPPGGDERPWPAPDDFAVDPTWSARRAFNFMRGTASWGQPYPVAVGEETLLLGRALGFDAAATLDVPLVREQGRVVVRCAEGVLEATWYTGRRTK